GGGAAAGRRAVPLGGSRRDGHRDARAGHAGSGALPARAARSGGGADRPDDRRQRADRERLAPGGAAVIPARWPREDASRARLVEVRFDRGGAGLWSLLYRLGRPVQYSYTAGSLELWHVQVGYASRPWAAEMPSAGRPLRWQLLLDLRERGVHIAAITHAAGL